MSCSWCLQSYLIVIFNILHVVWAVPPNYCLAPFNHSDCRLPPQHVFAYYKPGSRCELEVWRGCPTLNKFENEYLCSMNCIFRSGNAIAPLSVIDECALTLNTEKCNNETQTVYTHVDGRCIKAEWGGCLTFNKFDSKAECIEKCHAVNEDPISGSLNDLLEDINVILNHIIENVIENTTVTTDATTTNGTTATTNATPTTTDATPTTAGTVPTTADATPTTADATPTTADATPITADADTTTADATPTTVDAASTTTDAVPTTMEASTETEPLNEFESA